MTLEAQIAEAVRLVVREELRAALAEARGPEVISTEEAAELAHVTPKTVREWIRTGALAATRRGRKHAVRRDALMAYLAGHAAGTPGILASLRKVP